MNTWLLKAPSLLSVLQVLFDIFYCVLLLKMTDLNLKTVIVACYASGVVLCTSFKTVTNRVFGVIVTRKTLTYRQTLLATQVVQSWNALFGINLSRSMFLVYRIEIKIIKTMQISFQNYNYPSLLSNFKHMTHKSLHFN